MAYRYGRLFAAAGNQSWVSFENGVENVVSFLTDTISTEQLQILAALMDQVGCLSVELV
jgi:hypothetical protein